MEWHEAPRTTQPCGMLPTWFLFPCCSPHTCKINVSVISHGTSNETWDFTRSHLLRDHILLPVEVAVSSSITKVTYRRTSCFSICPVSICTSGHVAPFLCFLCDLLPSCFSFWRVKVLLSSPFNLAPRSPHPITPHIPTHAQLCLMLAGVMLILWWLSG